jgi:hypothetical protein
MAEPNEGPNFEAAEVYLAQAKASHEAGDEHRRRAACVMVMVALGFSDSSPRIHLGHLKK